MFTDERITVKLNHRSKLLVASLATTAALGLSAGPVLAAAKPVPKAGALCKKSEANKTSKDKKGVTLTCKKDAKGKYRWSKK